MKLNIHVSNLQKAEKRAETKSAKSRESRKIKSKSQNISTEIMLLGMTVDEAISTLEKYIDDAYLSGLNIIRIVHGKGTGQLRAGVQNYLKNNPHIKSYRLGVYGEGDTGVTIAELK